MGTQGAVDGAHQVGAGERLAAEQGRHRPDPFLQVGSALVRLADREAVHAVLEISDPIAGAHPENHAPAAHQVDGRGELGRHAGGRSAARVISVPIAIRRVAAAAAASIVKTSSDGVSGVRSI